jgi:arylsulfatase A-like enzyme
MIGKRQCVKFIRALVALSLVLCITSIARGQERTNDKPNILIFMADDLGWADPGFRGSPIETPVIDRLALEGVQLNRFYVAPICTPTRAGLMTGRDPVRFGVAYGVLLPWDSGGVHTDEHFMPESFRAAGYQTAAVGKWHLGHAQQVFHPNARGFDHFYGHLHTEVGFYPPFSNVGGKDFQRNGQSIDEDGYETYLLAQEATRWIKNRDKSRPFFL